MERAQIFEKILVIDCLPMGLQQKKVLLFGHTEKTPGQETPSPSWDATSPFTTKERILLCLCKDAYHCTKNIRNRDKFPKNFENMLPQIPEAKFICTKLPSLLKLTLRNTT